MSRCDDDRLVDSGAGRKLEQLGGILVDRPSPAARGVSRSSPLWSDAAVAFQSHCESGGEWIIRKPLPTSWSASVAIGAQTITLGLRLAPSGQIGVFPEQFKQWQWLHRVVRPGARMLSLFAHTGGASLAMAAAGAHVIHVDASRQAIATAKANAKASGLTETSIQWAFDDVPSFVARQIRRGRTFDGVVLDPPSWGHGPKGEAFAIDRDLDPLLRLLATVCDLSRGPWLITSHSPQWNAVRISSAIANAIADAGSTINDLCVQSSAPVTQPISQSLSSSSGIESGRLECVDDAGRPLEFGAFARRG